MEQIIADENREAVPHQENPFQAFLDKYIGMPDAVNLDEMNDLFFTPRFLDSPNRMQLEGRKTALESVVEPLEREKKLLEKDRGKLEKSKADTLKKSKAELRNINVQLGNQLLKLSLDASKNYRLEMNVQWRVPDQPASMKAFFELSPCQRKAALMCMIIMRSRLPVMIDAPEAEFDTEDMAKYLVPVILEYKDTRQILLFTSHPLLAVNTDPDNT